MIVRIDPESSVAAFEQLRSQVAAMITTGVLSNGTRLPTVRQLAADLRVAAGTVARAYRDLEQAGFVETRGRHGTYAIMPTSPAPREADRRLAHAARAFAMTATQVGATRADAVAAASQAIDELQTQARTK